MTTPTDTRGAREARNVRDATGLEIAPEPYRRSQWECRLVTTWGEGTRPEWDFGICKGCGCVIDDEAMVVSVAENELAFRATVCEPCMELVRPHYNGHSLPVEASETPKWDQHCPPRLQDALAATQLPASVDQAAYEKVTAWRPSDGKGLALFGPAGSGKSLSLWSLYRELERERMNPFAVSGVEFGRLLAKAARDIADVKWLARARILMIDDFGKERATPAVGALLWEVLDHRYNHALPLIFTSRFSGAELEARFGEQYLGNDIRRRLNAICRGVNFSACP